MLKLTVLGSGTPVTSYHNNPNNNRHTAGYLLQYDHKNILLDCSEGIRYRLSKVGVDYMSIDAIFITHFHPDHFNIDSLMQSIIVWCFENSTQKTLTVFGPSEIKQRINLLWDLKHNKGHYESVFSKYVHINYQEYQDVKTIIFDRALFTPYKIIHGKIDAYTLRIEKDNKVLCYSGDSGECKGIKKASNNADLFICDNNTNIREKDEENIRLHLDAYTAGLIAKESNVKHLVLTHTTGKNKKEDICKEVYKSGFRGKVNVASDFEAYILN